MRLHFAPPGAAGAIHRPRDFGARQFSGFRSHFARAEYFSRRRHLAGSGRVLPQLDDGQRGFSYMEDAPLDMRMDRSAGLTAYEVVNAWPREELRRILYSYGGGALCPPDCRSHRPPPCRSAHRHHLGAGGRHPLSHAPRPCGRSKDPAKRSFQAIRIAVNDELTAVERVMGDAISRLAPGGRLAVITFHSLEDRIVKNAMQEAAKGRTCPPEFPVCVCGRTPR